MKKITLMSLLAVVILLPMYLLNRFSSAREIPFYSVNNSINDSVLVIGVIGDSWVNFQELDSVIHYSLLEENTGTKVYSSGLPGAKTKQIYENLFDEDQNSFRFIIEKRPHFCIVIAGVNDAIGQYGPGYYTQNMILIVKTLLHYKIKPVIVELPEFGIEEANNEFNFIKRWRNKVFSFFTNSGKLDNIMTYRQEFKKEINNTGLSDSLIYVAFDDVCYDYKSNLILYENSTHLSKTGCDKLGKVIIDKLSLSLNN